jgi:hypothetical protein
MKVQELEEVLELIQNNNTEVYVEGSFNLKYKIKDFRLEKTTNTEQLYLVIEESPILNIPKNEDSASAESTK